MKRFTNEIYTAVYTSFTQQKYPNIFYPKSWKSGKLFLIALPFLIYFLYSMPYWIDKTAVPPVNQTANEDLVMLVRIVIGILLFVLTGSVVSDLWIARKPVIHIYWEGIAVRSFQKQKNFSIFSYVLTRGIFLPFHAFWRLATLRVFRAKTYYFHWDELDPVWITSHGFEINKKGKLSSVLSPNTYFTKDDYSIFFENGFFHYPTQAVGYIINLYGEDLAERAKLESWNDSIPG